MIKKGTYAEGASASIMKTIAEIEDILEGQSLKYGGPKRQILRDKLSAALIKSSKLWYKKGFNRGHRESSEAYKESTKFPTTITAEVQREFIPNSPKRVSLKSTLKKNK